MLTTFPPGIGVLAASANSNTSSICSNRSTIGSRIYHYFSFSSHSPPCPWVRWYHDHNRGAGWIPRVCGWRNWCRPDAAPWSNFTPVILKVAASVYLPHSPFGAIASLRLHDAECTLELQLQPHWLALDLLVADGPGAENIAQLQFVMWLVVLPSQGDHASPLPIMTGWLTRLLVFCDGFREWFCSRWPPHILLFSWRGIWREYLQVWKSFLVILVSPILVCLNFLESISPSSVCLNVSAITRILFSCVLARLEFSVLVIFGFRLGSKLPCLFPFFCCGSCAFSFLVDPVLFLFLFCLVYSNSSELDSCCESLVVGCLLSFDLSNVYWCGPIHSHMEG